MTYNAITCFSLSTLLKTADALHPYGWELVSHRCNPEVNLFEGIFKAQSPKKSIEEVYMAVRRELPRHDRDWSPTEET